MGLFSGIKKMFGNDESTKPAVANLSDGHKHAQHVIDAYGGAGNIISLNACMSRLRIEVADTSKINKDDLKTLGAVGVFEVGSNVQAVFGARAEIVKSFMADLLASSHPHAINTSSITGDFVMPLTGELISLADVPDQVFSTKVMGDGFAVKPSSDTLVSPVDGVVTMLFKTNHACVVTMADSVEVLMHIGMDTVNLGGDGFKALVSVNDKVTRGTPLISFDSAFIAPKVPSLITPIVFTNLADLGKTLQVEGYGSQYQSGDKLQITIK